MRGINDFSLLWAHVWNRVLWFWLVHRNGIRCLTNECGRAFWFLLRFCITQKLLVFFSSYLLPLRCLSAISKWVLSASFVQLINIRLEPFSHLNLILEAIEFKDTDFTIKIERMLIPSETHNEVTEPRLRYNIQKLDDMNAVTSNKSCIKAWIKNKGPWSEENYLCRDWRWGWPRRFCHKLDGWWEAFWW